MPKKPTPHPGGDPAATAAVHAPAEEGPHAAPTNGHSDIAQLLAALKTLKRGDFGVRLPVDETVVGAAIAEAFNDVADLLEHSTRETARIATVVGKEGRITQRAHVGAGTGSWADRIDSINTLIGDLVQPTEEVARVIGAVAKGDLSQRIPLEHEGTPLKGEFLRIGTTVNTMVDQLGSFASEVTRVAREVGTEGKLGGQAEVQGVAGTWKDLTDSVNSMAGNLTAQVRNIAQVTTAVANGDLSKKITVDVKGEILELKDTINTMVDQLGSFASEVTRVAREVGTEGRLGGQAQVRGVAGRVEGPDRQRQQHGRQPHRPGAQHRRGHHRRGQRRPLQEDHRRRQGRDPRAEEHHQHDGRPAQLASPRKSPASPARSAPRASSAARRRCRASAASGRT